MVFKDNFITVIKSGGNILREKNSQVLLPFGSEYSIFMKNQESKTAVVKITIDGQDVLNGTRIVIRPGRSTTLEGFLDDNGNVTNRFKFIKKTEKIVKHRGDKIDDGLIRIEYWYEKPIEYKITYTSPPVYRKWLRPYWPHYYGSTCRSLSGSWDGTVQANSCSNSSDFMPEADANIMHFMPQINDDEGITVKGSRSNQEFSATIVGTLETTSHVITLVLKGTTKKGEYIPSPITVKTKLVCETCGTRNRSTHRCCYECGTSLE